jgi:hypothetical protein
MREDWGFCQKLTGKELIIGSFLFNIDPTQFFAGKFRTQHIYLNPYHQMKIL